MEKATDAELYKASLFLQSRGYTIYRVPVGFGDWQWTALYPDTSGERCHSMEAAISAAQAHYGASLLNPKH